MNRIKLILLLGVTATFASCGARQTVTTQKTSDSMTAEAPLHHPETDPTPGWVENEPALIETFTAPIGKYKCPWGKTIGVAISNQKGDTAKREIPCNCATYGTTGLVIVDDSLSPFAGEFNPQMMVVELNRYRIKVSYLDVKKLLNGTGIDTISFVRFANAFLQQELWHKKNPGGTEFKSDVVSIKVAGEWFLCQSLVNLVAHNNGAPGPGTYEDEYETYKNIFTEAGLSFNDLLCVSKTETHGVRAKKILEKYPGLLTRVKNIILSRY